MAFTTNIDMNGMVPVTDALPRMAIRPPLELQPAKSPFFISSLPTTATVNPDSIRNFNTPGIPQYRITPPIPLTAASGGTNAVATVTTAPVLLQPTPAPSIASPLVTIPTGFQFSFNQVRLPLSSTLAISTYKIYRGSANNSASATVIQSIPHHPSGVGVPVTVQDNQVNGVVAFYWVSAVSTAGQESSLTAAQTAGVTSNAIANANSQLASSFHNQPINATFSPLSSTVLDNSGSSTVINISPTQLQFGSGIVTFNGASVDPGNYGTWYITGLDPHFAGGSIVFLASSSPLFQSSSDSSLNFGKILTAPASNTNGGGYTGGTTATSSPPTAGAGGRGITF